MNDPIPGPHHGITRESLKTRYIPPTPRRRWTAYVRFVGGPWDGQTRHYALEDGMSIDVAKLPPLGSFDPLTPYHPQFNRAPFWTYERWSDDIYVCYQQYDLNCPRHGRHGPGGGRVLDDKPCTCE